MLSVISPSLCIHPADPASIPPPSPSHHAPSNTRLTKPPQPWGAIPPRKKRQPVSRPSRPLPSTSSSPSSTSTPTTSPSISSSASSSTSSFSLATFVSSTSATPSSRFSRSSTDSALELMPTMATTTSSCLNEASSSSSARLNFWAVLRAQYFGAWSNKSSSLPLPTRSPSLSTLSPAPVALVRSNTTAVSTPNATLSLPDLDSLQAMDKFKPARSDTIALKTFAYHETPVQEMVSGRASVPSTRSRRSTHSRKGDRVMVAEKSNCDSNSSLLPVVILPRNAIRETRSNSDYLRMMASEMQMIRARKLIAPLKPRASLPRRRDVFCQVKSSLCVSSEMPRPEDDHPLNNLLVGSYSSVSSTESFMSSHSSDYATADESFD